jgi:hypothetical protein
LLASRSARNVIASGGQPEKAGIPLPLRLRAFASRAS